MNIDGQNNQTAKQPQPYNIQILLNFNSKSIVNNNILPQDEQIYKIRNKNLIKHQKNQKPFIFPSKNSDMTPRNLFRKNNNKKFDECQIANNKNKQKLNNKLKSQTKDIKKHKSHTASIIQQTRPVKNMAKKKSLQFIQTGQFHQIHKARQVKCKSTFQKKIKDKNLRQNLLQLMIKDYEKGVISAQNFKQAISSLIDDQILKKGNSSLKAQIKSNCNPKGKTTTNISNLAKTNQNHNSFNNSLIRYSYTTSLKNTPKHKKPHSKSQKFYKLSKQQQPQSYRQDSHQEDNCKDDLQHQLTQRVIQKRQFLNKIVIKGINSSLFLNNDDDMNSKYESPKKQDDPVQVYVLNTSDSVRQLKQKMIASQMNSMQTKNRYKQHCDQRINPSLQEKMAVKIQKAWRCYKTKKLLYRIHAQIRYIDSINYRNIHQNQESLVRGTNSTSETNNNIESSYNMNGNSIRILQNESDFQIESVQRSLEQDCENQFQLKVYEQDNASNEFQKMQNLVEKEQEDKYQDWDQSKNSNSEECQMQAQSRILVFQRSPLFEQFQKNDSQSSEKKIEKFMSSQLADKGKKSQLTLNKKLQKQKFDNIKNLQLQKWDQVMDYVKYHMQNSQISKEECLNNIVQYFQNQKKNVQDQLSISKTIVPKDLKKKTVINVGIEQKGYSSSKFRNNSPFINESWQKNIQTPKKPVSKLNQPLNLQQSSNQLQLSQQLSFCHSIQFNNNQQQIMSAKSKEMLKQLKTIDVDFIQQTLRKRQTELIQKRDKQIHVLTDRFINDRVNSSQFQQQKDRLQKWFSLQMKELKKTRKKFQKGMKQAKQVLFRTNYGDQSSNKNISQKQSKMIKCLSQSYLRNNFQQFNSSSSSKNNINQHSSSKTKQRINIQAKIKNKLILKVEEKVDLNQNQNKIQKKGQKLKNIREIKQNQRLIQQIIGDQNQGLNEQMLFQTSNNEQMLFSGKFLQNQQNYSPTYSQEKQAESQNLTQSPEQLQSPKVIFNTLQSQKTSVNLFQKSSQFDITPNYKPKYQELSKEFDEYEMSNNQSDQDITLGNNINQKNKLFKNLCTEDKQDIFQFMFLDLCLQLFIEQQKNSKIIKSVQSYIKHLRKQRKSPKGIKTNYQICRNYLGKFMVYLRDVNFQFFKRLEVPMGPTAKQMLKYMRQTSDDDDQYSNSSESQQNNISIILSIQIFEKFQSLSQNQLIVQTLYQNVQKQKQRILFLKSVSHIFNKAMFDSLNQALDHQRPYGIWGKPFPWKKTMIVDRKFDERTKENKLKRAVQKVVQNCSYLCGIMPDKEDSVFGNSKVSIQYVQRIREDRMSRMLSNDLLDNQDRWIFYDDEQTQILIDISKHVTKLLIYEVLLDLKKILF